MAKSQATFMKKQREKKRKEKKEDKAIRAEERRASSAGGGLDAMIAYINEDGEIVDTPPDNLHKNAITPKE